MKRNYGIDMLRILSMFLIVTLHVIGQGGLMVRNTSALPSYYAMWFVETAATCAVNVYGLISGYVGVDSKFRPARIIELWLQVFFYTALITLIAAYFEPTWINETVIRKSLMPVMWKTYWYFSGYFVLFLFEPFLNVMVRGLSVKQCKALMGVIFFALSVLTVYPKAFDVDTLTLLGGYSLMWLIALYLMGACIKRVQPRRWKTWSYLVIYLVMTVIAWGYKILIENYTRARYGEALHGRALVTYTAPTILICAICLLMIFSGIQVKKQSAIFVVKYLSAATLSVYVIHTHPIVWDHLLKNLFHPYYTLEPVKLVPFILFNALWVFLLCSLIDQIRIQLFKLLRVRKGCEWLSGRILHILRW